jgi:post-segregation antitoxin (ccd killing protein)
MNRRKPGPKVDPKLGALERHTMTLDRDTVRMAKVLGKNVSDGIRNAVRTAYRAYQRSEE